MKFSFDTVADSSGRITFLKRHRNWFTHELILRKTSSGYDAVRGEEVWKTLDERGRLTIADLANKPLRITATLIGWRYKS